MDNFYVVEITGKNPKMFIKYLIKNNINIYGINHFKNKIIIKILDKDYNKLKKIKTSYHIKLINIIGIKRLKWLFQKYQLFIIMFLISIISVVFFSNIIFKINIKADKEITKILHQELKESNITPYSFKKSYQQLNIIKNNIKNKYNNLIEWIEIEENGITYNIEAIRRINSLPKQINELNNIIARKDGIIIEIKATKGEVVKNPGDYVRKGDIIISGIIKNKEDVVNITDATGKVYAEVWYKVNIKHPINYLTKNYIGKTKSNYYIVLLGKKIDIIKNNNYETIKSNTLVKNNVFSIVEEKQKKINTQTIKYDLNNLQKVIENIAKEKIQNFLDKDEEILLQKTLKKGIENDKMNMEIFFKVKEEIGKKEKIISEE